jgi:hypothetical protein
VASPYLVVHAVYQVQQYATPAPPHPPNIIHQAQCDPAANISATSDITILINRVQLAHPFLVASADRTSPAMLASSLGTYVLRLSDGTTRYVYQSSWKHTVCKTYGSHFRQDHLLSHANDSSCPQTLVWSQGGWQCSSAFDRISRNPVRQITIA